MSQADLPSLLAGATEGEDVVARVNLGGEDTLAVTPTRTLVYRAEGLLSDESVEEYPHDVERIEVSEGRRKAKITLEYGLDGAETITVPSKRLDDALHPILAGVLSAAGVTGPGESVQRTFRFSELTLIVTSGRLVKHVGSAVWDEEHEEFPYENVTDLGFEEGTVATSVVVTHDGRQERFKAPNESERALREALTDAVCDYHDVGSLAELRLTMEDEEAATEDDPGDSTTDFGDGPDPLSASPAAAAEEPSDQSADAGAEGSEGTDPLASGSDESVAGGTDAAAGSTAHTDPTADPTADRTAAPGASGTSGATDAIDATDAEPVDRGGEPDDGFGDSGFEPAGVEGDPVAEEVAALREAVEDQSERLDRQSELIEQLIEELRRGR